MPRFLSPVDLAKNQLLNAAVHNASSAPASPVEGQIYYDTVSKNLFYWNNTQWVNASSVDLSGLITKTTLNAANTILKADSANTPTALAVSDQSVVGRVSNGVVGNVALLSNIASGATDANIPTAKAAKDYADTKQSALTFGIANTNAIKADGGSIAAGQYAVFTANGINGIAKTSVVADIGAIPASALDTDPTLAADSDSNIATQKAVKAYIDGNIAAANAMVYKGTIDASTNPNYPPANAGDTYVISVAGKIGGASGVDVDAGDMIVCKTDSTAGGNQATVGAQWNIVEKNSVGAVTGPAASTDLHIAVFDGSTGKVIADGGVTIASLQGQNATHDGDVTGSTTLTIAAKAVTLTKMADLAASSIIGNNTGAPAVPKALTAAEVRTMLNVADGATANVGTVIKYAANIGDGSTTNIVITHSMGTRDLTVQVFENATPWSKVEVDVELTSTTTLTLKFAVAPAAGAYRVVVTA